MNERIKELSAEAWKYAKETVGYNEFGYHDAFEQKFAELLIQECMEQVWYTREDGINGNVSQVIKDRIKEHFGVEE